MWLPAGVLITGLVAVIFATERYGLRFGGVVVVPLLGLYVLFDYRALPLFLISAATAYVALNIMERRIVLYGRRLFITAIVVGAWVPISTYLLAQYVWGTSLPLQELAYLGSILPGIAAYNLHRLDREDRLADVLGSLALVVGLVLLAAVYLLPRAALSRGARLDAVWTTAQQMVLGQYGPILPAPDPILPRWIVVGLFLGGFLASEFIRRRHGVRLAGVIAVPLVAVFALQDLGLLVAYLGAVVVGAVFIRLIHRSTFLYGRNLLAGTCVVGVIVGAAATPFLATAVGLRPLMVGLLGGVTAYNGHVLSPGERIQSVLITAGAFVVLFGATNWIAGFLGRGVYDPVTGTEAIVGATVVLTALLALWEMEARRPDQPIQPIANGNDAIFPDGGISDFGKARPDGGRGDPLAGRTVVREGPRVQVVTRRTREADGGERDR